MIAEARAWIDEPPWQPGAVNRAPAADGAFDQPVQALAGTLDSSALAAGLDPVYVRARDAAGDWGAVAALLAVVDPADVPVVQGAWSLGQRGAAAATVSIGPFPPRTDPTRHRRVARTGELGRLARAPSSTPGARRSSRRSSPRRRDIPLDFALPAPLFAGRRRGRRRGRHASGRLGAAQGSSPFSGSRPLVGQRGQLRRQRQRLGSTSPMVDLSEATEVRS